MTEVLRPFPCLEQVPAPTQNIRSGIDFLKVCKTVTIENSKQTERKYSLTPYINSSMALSFGELVKSESEPRCAGRQVDTESLKD